MQEQQDLWAALGPCGELTQPFGAEGVANDGQVAQGCMTKEARFCMSSSLPSPRGSISYVNKTLPSLSMV